MTYLWMLGDRGRLHTRPDCIALHGKQATRHDLNGAVVPESRWCQLCRQPAMETEPIEVVNSKERIIARMDQLRKDSK
jgi:hypothetical protein